jgi:hypothetical protein
MLGNCCIGFCIESRIEYSYLFLVEGLCSNLLGAVGSREKAGTMKRKHAEIAAPRIKVITDPKKLAWLRAKLEARLEARIEPRKAAAKAVANEGPSGST